MKSGHATTTASVTSESPLKLSSHSTSHLVQEESALPSVPPRPASAFATLPRAPSPVSDMVNEFSRHAHVSSGIGRFGIGCIEGEGMELDDRKITGMGDNYMIIPRSPSLAPDPQHPNNELLNDTEQRWFSDFLNQVDVDQDFVFDFALPDLPILPSMLPPPPPPPPFPAGATGSAITSQSRQHDVTTHGLDDVLFIEDFGAVDNFLSIGMGLANGEEAVASGAKRKDGEEHVQRKSPNVVWTEGLNDVAEGGQPTDKGEDVTSSSSPASLISPAAAPTETPAPTSNAKTGRKPHRELLTEEEKRANHIASEQKRRNLIRSGFRDLTEIVPSLRNANHSKSTVLFQAIEYIQRLEQQTRILRERVAVMEVRAENKFYGHMQGDINGIGGVNPDGNLMIMDEARRYYVQQQPSQPPPPVSQPHSPGQKYTS
ncbi:uncharacterized protein VTP21DRAFT_6529 [Calcarisporiella thermophila]|uniref:uncharacterized protein n=1 Tax=Calcarisporiella thermophila TaxID=911321 RepID=UPI0037431678